MVQRMGTGAFGNPLMATVQKSLSHESRDMGLATLAEGMRDDPDIKQILRDVLSSIEPFDVTRDLDGRGDPMQAQLAAATDPRAAPAAARERSGAARNPDIADAAVELDEDGRLSLRQVLHAIASPAKRIKARSRGSQDGNDDVDDDDGGGFDLTSRLLESRFLGEAMEHVIELNSIDNSFSIFGVGRFEPEVGADSSFVLTDLTSSFSLTLSPDGPPDDGSRPRPAGPKIDLVAVVLGVLESPTGVLTSIFAGTLLMLWSTMRLAALLRR